MGLFARCFGWTPDIVGSLPLDDFLTLAAWLERNEAKQDSED